MNATDADRRAQFVRQWQLLLALRQGPRTLQELADALGVSTRTVRRDIYALQRVPLPIMSRFAAGETHRTSDPNVWCLGEIPAWPRREAWPVGAIAPLQATA